MAQLELDSCVREITDLRKAEFEMRREPFRLHRIAGCIELMHDVLEIALDEVRQHEAIVQLRTPANESCRLVGLLPEFRDQGSQQQLLSQTHLRMRWHFECAHLE